MKIIYELIDPRSGESRYVGQCKNTRKRLIWHMGDAQRGRRGAVYEWLRSLRAAYVRPRLAVLERCPVEVADGREQFWIQARRAAGSHLTNRTTGGVIGYRHASETKTAIGAAHSRKVVSHETRALLSKIARGRGATGRKWGAALVGRALSTGERKAISERMKGNQHGKLASHSQERREATSKRFSGEKGYRAKLTNAQAAEARRLFDGGMTQAAIMRLFNISRVDAHRVARGKTYKNLEGEVPAVAHQS